MRVLLLNPPYPVCEGLTMPLGLLYLAATLEEAGHQVKLEDWQLCRSPITRLQKTLKLLNPQVVGVTSFSINLMMASRLFRTAKRLCPDALTVWGGPHVSFDDETILRNHPWVDAIVRGEGEETLVEMMERMERGQGLNGIWGTTWRKSDGSLQRNPSRPLPEPGGGFRWTWEAPPQAVAQFPQE